MSPKLEVMANKLRRGWVIRILGYHSAELNDKLLQQALSEAGHHVSMATLHGDLEYLEEKGYVALERPELGLAVDMVTVSITAKGVDLREGSITDPGIDLGHGS
jgi:hypothetical protein